MTKIKICGLSRLEDVEAINILKPDYIGFVFAEGSKRRIDMKKAAELKQVLDKKIKAVGVFVQEDPVIVADMLNSKIIDIVQLHGGEDEKYLKQLKMLTDKPVIKVFKAEPDNVKQAEHCSADYIMFDSGAGTGKIFDWDLLVNCKREYFLAGGLNISNVKEALRKLQPFAVDVSSGVETEGLKDKVKMAEFIVAVRKEDYK